jgi:hypothetical protein
MAKIFDFWVNLSVEQFNSQVDPTKQLFQNL